VLLVIKGCKRDAQDLYNRWPRIMRRSAPVLKAMWELVKLFTQIALLRRGPQDLPASMLLLALTVLAYLGMNIVMNSLLPAASVAAVGAKATDPDASSWPAQLLLDSAFTLVWYVGLLRVARRPERTLQTTTAVFGFQIVLAPLLFLSSWLWPRFMHDTTWGVPVALFGIVLLIWLIAANSHIVKAALEWSGGASVALVILQILAAELLRRALFVPAPG
jgi:hypothetical protein